MTQYHYSRQHNPRRSGGIIFFKKNQKNFKWRTQKGANIEATITVNHITSKTVELDGITAQVECNEWERKVESVKVNGKEMPMHELLNSGKEIVVNVVNNQKAIVLIPAEIVEEMFAEQNEQAIAAINAEMEAEARRTAIYEEMNK